MAPGDINKLDRNSRHSQHTARYVLYDILPYAQLDPTRIHNHCWSTACVRSISPTTILICSPYIQDTWFYQFTHLKKRWFGDKSLYENHCSSEVAVNFMKIHPINPWFCASIPVIPKFIAWVPSFCQIRTLTFLTIIHLNSRHSSMVSCANPGRCWLKSHFDVYSEQLCSIGAFTTWVHPQIIHIQKILHYKPSVLGIHMYGHFHMCNNNHHTRFADGLHLATTLPHARKKNARGQKWVAAPAMGNPPTGLKQLCENHGKSLLKSWEIPFSMATYSRPGQLSN